MIHKNNNCVTVIDQHSLTLPRCLAANTRPLISLNPAQTSRVVYPCFRSYLANVRKYLHESEHESKEFTLRGRGSRIREKSIKWRWWNVASMFEHLCSTCVFKKGRKRGKRWLSFPHQDGTDRYYQCKSLTNVIDKYLWRFMNIRACRPRLARIKRVCSKLSLSLSLRLRARFRRPTTFCKMCPNSFIQIVLREFPV